MFPPASVSWEAEGVLHRPPRKILLEPQRNKDAPTVEKKATHVNCVDSDQTCVQAEVSQLESQLSEKTANVEALALDVGDLEAQVKTANEEAAEVRIR